VRSRVADPHLRDQKLESEAEPEGDAEKIVRCQMRQPARSEKHTYNGSDCRDGHPDRKRTDHPFAVLAAVATADIDKAANHGEQEKTPEERGGGRFGSAANRHLRTHHQRRSSDHHSKPDHCPPDPAVQGWPAHAYTLHELKRREQHEKQSRNDVNDCQRLMARESSVKPSGRARSRNRIRKCQQPSRDHGDPDQR